MGSPLPHLMGLHTIMRLAIYCSLAGVMFAINGLSTVDKRCCAFKHVSSGVSDYEGSYRLIPDDEVYVDDLPAECSYSCVYMKEGNPDDQFCFQQTDQSDSDTFSQCQAGPTRPSVTSPLLTTSAPAHSPGSTQTTGQSPVPMTTSTTGQSPVPMTTPSATVSPFSMPPTFMTTQEEEVTLSKVSRPSTLEPTG